jgi:anti-anti-sigma regulatory factor
MGEFALVVHTESTADGSTRIGVLRPLTHATAPALRDALRRVIDADPAPRSRLDLTCFTDVDGLLALSLAQHAALLRGGDLHLDNVPALIQRQVHNFDDLL